MINIEYSVRPVTRYIVTRWESSPADGGGLNSACECLGEFDNLKTADRVGHAVYSEEHAKAHENPRFLLYRGLVKS